MFHQGTLISGILGMFVEVSFLNRLVCKTDDKPTLMITLLFVTEP